MLAMFSVAVHTVLLLIGIATSTTLAEWPRTTTSATGLVSAGGWLHGRAGIGQLMAVIPFVVRQCGWARCTLLCLRQRGRALFTAFLSPVVWSERMTFL